MKRIIFLSLIAAILFSGCKKNNLNEKNITGEKIPGYALVKFVNSYTALTPSLGVPANGPIVDFYINNRKMNGALGTAGMGYGFLFPNISGAFDQAPGGVVNIKAVLNRPTGVGGLASDTITSNTFTLGPDVAHSIILVDTLPNPTPYNPILMVVQESVSMPAYGKFKLRLMNLVATNEVYELYNLTSSTLLNPGGINYKNFSDWIELPVTNISNTYQIRLAGTTTVMATATLTGANQRSYTFWARGNPAVGKARTLSSYISQ